MRIILHDYAGHPFTADLARALAGRGHRVSYAWFAQDAGPKGRIDRDAGDPETLAFCPLDIAFTYSKSDFLRRRKGDIAYGRAIGELIRNEHPEAVISGNTPTETQEHVIAACQAVGARFVYWCQDFYSVAAGRLLARRLPGPGHAVGAWYRRLERRQMQRAHHVVHITDAFLSQTDRWGIPRHKVIVIPNWGTIADIPVLARDTAWAVEQRLGPGPRYLYSGTLAMKHNPELLAALARSLPNDQELLLVSAGVGADRLAARTDLPRLRCLPLQPFDRFAEVLGAADVVLAVIERDAGEFSVPSKVLSYLCAGRPIVLAAPHDNLAARILAETGAGEVVEPEDVAGFVAAAQRFAIDFEAARCAAQAGRAYAEAHFRIAWVAERFEAVLAGNYYDAKTGSNR